MFLFLLPQPLEMSNVGTKRLKECILVVVPHTELLACFTYNRSYFWIVNLTHAWEQVMSSLMVQSTWKMGKKVIINNETVTNKISNARYLNSLIIYVSNSKCCKTRSLVFDIIRNHTFFR